MISVIHEVDFQKTPHDEKLQYLIDRSKEAIKKSRSRETFQPDHIESEDTRRSEIDHIHSHKINFLQSQAQDNMNYASQEKVRVAELKMKTAELTQIIEEGNLANSSTQGSAGVIRKRYD